MHSTRIASAGFTILELMVGITVLGVLFAIGIPSFNEMTRNNRAITQANELLTALSLARSEAMKLGMPVSICAANAAQTACAGNNTDDWVNGWLVFSDRIGTAGTINPAVPTGDQILQTSHAISGGLTLTSGAVGFVRFGASGGRIDPAGANVTFGVEHRDCTGDNRRTITINLTGRANLQKVACT
jgi:type IV fimbrial biogenesis protein FimT